MEDGHSRSSARSRVAIKSYSALFIFRYLSSIVCFYFISFFYFLFCVYPHYVSSPCCLVAWNPLGTTTQASPYATISTHKGSEKNIHSIFFSFLLFPFAPRLFPCCLLWFQNVFSLHEILLILFSLVFSFVGLTFKKNGWRNPTFFLRNLRVFHILSCRLSFAFTRKSRKERKYI
jgi:hypothetical protein